MIIEVGAIDHDPVGPWAFGREALEQPGGHAQRRPAGKAVAKELMQLASLGGVLPRKGIPSHLDDASHQAHVIDTRYAIR